LTFSFDLGGWVGFTGKDISNHVVVMSSSKTHSFTGWLRASTLLVVALLAAKAQADVKLPVIFTDNMVLQQGLSVPVWGWADEGETVTVQFRDQRLTAKPVNGKWTVKLKSLKAGGPDELVIHGKNRIQLKNVLVGEVWVCSGQSNMEFPLSRSFESQKDIAQSANSNLRLFKVQKAKADEPLSDLRQPWNVGKFAWQESSSQSSADFSAVGYYFGQALQKARGVPIGLIESDWGGSPAEVWMSQETLEGNAGYKADIWEKYPVALKTYEDALAKHKAAKATSPAPRAPWKPAELYNGMIHPILGYGIAGVIWYQGESNAGRAWQYRTLFPDLIKNWRKDWGQGDFAFLFVQLAPFDGSKKPLEEIMKTPGDSTWGELREAQTMTLKLSKTGMAVITDVGEKDDIHPTKKQPVGERLALAARGEIYKEKIVFSGPMYKSLKIKGNQAIVSFDYVGGGLEAKGGKLTGFAICGEDKKWVWADAETDGKVVTVSSPQVAKPVAVRYGWSNFPIVNLFNKDGLPASPFRTDEFPGITQPKDAVKK
jgi:sialate O-acetylesterase